MTAKPSFSLRPSTALGRTWLLTVTTAVAIAISAGLGVSASRAATGNVYFDANGNAAAGETLFNGTFTGAFNVGLGRSVMPNLTHRQLQRRHRRRCAGRQHVRQCQRRHRPQRAVLEHDRLGQRRARRRRRAQSDHGLQQRRNRQRRQGR